MDSVLFASVINIVAGVGQLIFLPLFISTFTSTNCQDKIETGSFFVLFIMSTSFVIIFGLGSAYDFRQGTLTVEMMKKYHRILVTIGFADALNGFLVVFASSLGRTDGALQSILTQLLIPAMFVLSKLLVGITITRRQVIPVIVVFVGVFVGIFPNFLDAGSSESFVYPIMFALSVIPGAYIQVIQHEIFINDPHYSRNWLLLGESVFQVVTIVLFFWIDLIPKVGTSASLKEFEGNFSFGFQCFFDPYSTGGRCYYCFPIGFAFCLSYCCTYYCQSKLIKLQSANYSSVVTAVCPAIAVVMWVSIQSMTEWGCGSEYSHLQIIMSCTSIPFIVYGAYSYKETSEEKIQLYEPLENLISRKQDNV
jgi:drug/metabolite transporter (DMT)-like permease